MRSLRNGKRVKTRLLLWMSLFSWSFRNQYVTKIIFFFLQFVSFLVDNLHFCPCKWILNGVILWNSANSVIANTYSPEAKLYFLMSLHFQCIIYNFTTASGIFKKVYSWRSFTQKYLKITLFLEKRHFIVKYFKGQCPTTGRWFPLDYSLILLVVLFGYSLTVCLGAIRIVVFEFTRWEVWPSFTHIFIHQKSMG